MKHVVYIVILLIVPFVSCNKEKDRRANLCRSAECNLINDVFLDLVGTWDYYENIDIEEAENAVGQTDSDEIMRYLEQNKEITKKELIIYYTNGFLSNSTKQGQRDSLTEHYRENIRLVTDLDEYKSIGDIPDVIKELSFPITLDYSEVTFTGKYNLVPIEQKEKIKEDTKVEKIIAISNIHFNDMHDKALFYYEIGCIDGFKCSQGNVVICQKTDEGWKVLKNINVWIS